MLKYITVIFIERFMSRLEDNFYVMLDLIDLHLTNSDFCLIGQYRKYKAGEDHKNISPGRLTYEDARVLVSHKLDIPIWLIKRIENYMASNQEKTKGIIRKMLI